MGVKYWLIKVKDNFLGNKTKLLTEASEQNNVNLVLGSNTIRFDDDNRIRISSNDEIEIKDGDIDSIKKEELEYARLKVRTKLARLAEIDKIIESKLINNCSLSEITARDVKGIIRIALVKGFLINSRLVYNEKVFNELYDNYNEQVMEKCKRNVKTVINETIQLLKEEGVQGLNDGKLIRIPSLIKKSQYYVKAGYNDYLLDSNLNLVISRYVVEKGEQHSIIGNDKYNVYNESKEEFKFDKNRNCVERQKYQYKHLSLSEELYEDNLKNISGCYVERQYLIPSKIENQCFLLESDSTVRTNRCEFGEMTISSLNKKLSNIQELVLNDTKRELKKIRISNVQNDGLISELETMQKQLAKSLNI